MALCTTDLIVDYHGPLYNTSNSGLSWLCTTDLIVDYHGPLYNIDLIGLSWPFVQHKSDSGLSCC